ncbi:MAG: diacylglycerol kinase family protein [Thermodesulfobacteriota bacterium]|nr:MAG: diacylglycerol kinase family protein [Thermodesulfobacteriota bacterium]
MIFYSLQPKDISCPGWLTFLDEVSKVLIIGGDGTLHHTIQHLINKPVEINLVPAGTANDFARWVGLFLNPLKSLDQLENGKTIKYDTISANGRHVVSGGGFGLGFLVADNANRLKKSHKWTLLMKLTGDKIYSLLLVWHSIFARNNTCSFRITDNEDVRDYISHACVFTNQASIGKNIVVAPGTKATDGLFHFLLFKNPSCQSVLYSLLKIKMGLSSKDRYQCRQEVNKISIYYNKRVPAFGDGEVIPESEHWDLCCHKGALNMRVPEKFNGL